MGAETARRLLVSRWRSRVVARTCIRAPSPSIALPPLQFPALASDCRQSHAHSQPLQSLVLAFKCLRSHCCLCSSFLHARAVLCVAAIACDRTAVKTPALVSGSVGAETAAAVARA